MRLSRSRPLPEDPRLPEEVTPTAPRVLRSGVLAQSWLDLTMLHWAVEPELVAPHLPAGTTPDLLDGRTYVGLIGFRMHRLGLARGPRVPYFGDFPETNVRLYSVDAAGRRGVVFCSLDASRLVPVLVARISLRLGYQWSKMRVRREGSTYEYTCRRRWPGPAAVSHLKLRVGPPIAEPTPLEHFVTARWGLHTAWYGRTIYVPNVHGAWPLRAAEVLDLDDGLLAAAGFALPGAPDSVLYSPGVDVRFGISGRASA